MKKYFYEPTSFTAASCNRNVVLFSLLLSLAAPMWAQTTLISPSGDGGFETGADFASNGWSFDNGAVTNKWFVGTVPAGFTNRCAYISNNGGTNWTYTNTAVSVVHFWRDVTIPAGETNIVLTFNWQALGETFSFDALMVSIAPTSYVPAASGISLTTSALAAPAITLAQLFNAGSVQTATIALPPALVGNCATIRLIFSWKSDNTAGNNPPAAIDNISLTSTPVTPQVSAGPFTIDNTLPTSGTNFANFTAAINWLNTICVTNPVVFNVAAGETFNENPPVIMASGIAAYPITFQKSGVGANPVLTPTGTAGAVDFGICISGGDYFTFDGIDINASTVSAVEYGYLIRNISSIDGAQNNTIKNCSITLNRAVVASRAILQTTTTTGGGVTPTSVSGANSNNKYYNLSVQNVYAGVYLLGTSTFPDLNCELGNSGGGTTTIGGAAANDIGNSTFQTWGIRAASQNGVKIFNAEVRNVGSTTTTDGVLLELAQGISSVNNVMVHDIRGTSTTSTLGISGIRATHATTGTHTIRIYNNLIYGISSAYTGAASAIRQLRGIYLQGSGGSTAQDINVDFNSVRMDGSASPNISNTCFEIATVTGPIIRVRNNIFANFSGTQTSVSKHYNWVTAGATTGNSGSVSNRNVLYLQNTTNGFTGLASAADRATLANWQSTTSQDAASFSGDPQLISASNLHISTSVSTPVESGAAYFNGAITWADTDIDGEVRNGTTPDIGADEGNFIQLDNNAPAISYSPLPNICSTDDITLSAVSISDQTGVPTSGNLVPRIYYRNGSGPWFSQPGTLSSGTALDGIWSFTIVVADMGGIAGGDVVSYYLIAQDVSTPTSFVGSAPAEVVAADVNTVTTPPVTPNTIHVNFLNGTYTVGAGGNFSTLTEAVNAYNASCITGPVVFSLTDLNYTTSETLPISINANPGASATNTLTIQPVSSAFIAGTSSTCIIRLNGADYVNIDGSMAGSTSRNIIIQNYSTATGTAAVCISSLGPNAGATHNTIQNCEIGCFSYQSTSTNETFGILSHGATISTSSDGADNDYNSFVNNLIRVVRWGIYVRGTSDNPNDNTLIAHNVIGPAEFGLEQIGRGGIVLQHQNAAMVTQNEVRFVGVRFSQTAAGSDRVGIGLGDVAWPIPSATTITNTTVSGNLIHDVIEEKTFSSVGILVGGSGTPSGNTIANNMIYNVRANGTGGDQSIGIGIGAGNGDQVVFNTISLTGDLDPSGAAAGTQSAVGIRISSTTPTNLTLKNNISTVDINSNTGTLKHFSIVAPLAYNWGSGGLNNNDYYINSANPQMALAGTGTAVPYTPVTTLTAWQSTFSPNQDGSSKSVAPVFASATDLHLHINSNLPLNGAGTPISGISTDYDGQTRHATTPDIGADEFMPPANDAALVGFVAPQSPFTTGPQSVKVILKNNGEETLQSATIGWQVNGAMQAAYNWSGTLPSGDTLQVSIGSVTLIVGVAYNLKAWSSNPNGATDPVPSNDTIIATDVTQLAGIYTIGGTNPDFNTFTDAVNALHLVGVADAVIFKVRNGTYNEQISINPIAGVDDLHPVTFQSESGDSSLVILSFSANSSNNYTLQLNGADWLTFKQMTIQALNSTYGRAVMLIGGADHNTWTNNALKGVSTTSGYSGLETVDIPSGYGYGTQYNTFNNNRILNGNFGISYNSAALIQGTVIIGNTFENQYYSALYLGEHEAPLINKNIIVTNSTYGTYTGLDLNYCYNVRITNNKIYGLGSGATGISLNYVHGDLANPCIVANNFIQIGGTTSQVTGISSTNSSYQNLLYNTVRITNTNTASSALYSLFGNNNALQNNVFANTGGGYTINVAYNANTLIASNYNDLFTTGAFIGSWASINQATLANWKSASSFDANSISIDPRFIAANGYEVSDISLNNAGLPTSLVSTDIEGKPRDSTHPDLGAVEFAPLALDAALSAISSPKMPFVAGAQPVKAVLKNNGADALHDVAISWTINGIEQTAVNWSGTLPSGDTVSVLLGTPTFQIGVAYNLLAWSSSPNGMTDIQPVNDTARQNNLSPSLGGIYTIGGLDPDFNTFTDAVNALHLAGVAGSVVFKVRNGTYNEQISIQAYLGADTLRPVIFQSEMGDSSLVILTYSSTDFNNNYTLQLNGANWVTFKQLTIQATGYYARAVVITGGSSHNQWLNNRLEGIYSPTNDPQKIVVNIAQGSLVQYNVFRNNHILGGSYGIRTSGSTYISGTRVEENIFENQGNVALSLFFQNAPSVKNNLVLSTSQGLYLLNISGGKITGNKIYLTYGGTGIYVSNSYNVLIANNFIRVGGSSASNGIYSQESQSVKFLFNSIVVTNTNTTSAAFYTNSGNSNVVQNNIFMNTGGGYAMLNVSVGITSDYNDLFVTGTYLCKWYYTDLATLQSWQTTTGLDAHSRSVDPLFASATDFHITNAALNQKGIPDAAVLTDIEGDPRDPAKPDMGADEFTPAANDAGVTAIKPPQAPFPSGTHPVEVSLKNNGADTLKNVTIQWAVNDVPQPPYNWTGALPSGEILSAVPIGSFEFGAVTKYAIRAWTINPNGFSDILNLNDTASIDHVYAALGGTYTIGGTTPDFTTFQAAVDALQYGGVVNAVFFNARNGNYDVQVSIPQILGASPTNTITFQSETGDSSAVILTKSISYGVGSVIVLNGADYFTFRKLTMTTNSGYYGPVVELSNGAHNNSFLNNRFQNKSFYSGSTLDTNTIIRNNRFENCSISLYGPSYYYSGSGNPFETGIVIENNEIYSQNGVLLYFQDAPQIKNNIINTISSYGIGVRCNNCNNNLKIINNKISVNSNEGHGISVDGTGTANKRGLVANNFVHVGGTYPSYGIELSGGAFLNVYDNNVNLTNSDGGSSALYISYGSNKNLLNNIFSNKGGGYSAYIDGPSGIAVSDYNDFFTTGANLGNWNGVNVTDLATLQASSGKEAHSLSVDPYFVSDTDLHISQVQLDSAGLAVPEVTTDIDGEPRDATHPDIGADENNTVTTDIGVSALVAPDGACGLGSAEHFDITINNYGASPASGFQVAYKISGHAAVVENVGALIVPPGNSVNYTFTTTVNLSNVGNYSPAFYTLLDNDADASNDTFATVIANPSANAVTRSYIFPKKAVVYVCEGNSINLQVREADAAIWSNGTTGLNIGFAPASDTTVLYVEATHAQCTFRDTVEIRVSHVFPEAPQNMTPNDQSGLQDEDLYFEWSPVSGAASYDVYVWPATDPQPDDPVILNTRANRVFFSIPDPVYNGHYKWQVVANNLCGNAGAIQEFVLRNLPDLEVTNIQVPNTIISGENLTISYTVRNNGPGYTGFDRHWSDHVYFSDDPTLQPMTDVKLGDVGNLSALYAGETYTQSATFHIPIQPTFSGEFYVIVDAAWIGSSTKFPQVNTTNDITASVQKVTVILPDQSDLQVVAGTCPVNFFSNSKINVNWTIQNKGLGKTNASIWRDVVRLVKDTSTMSNALTLGFATHNGILYKDSSYHSSILSNKIPPEYEGLYYVVISADDGGAVWEFVDETNNRKVIPVEIILAPAPDLVPKALQLPDTIYYGIPFQGTLGVYNQGFAPSEDATTHELRLTAFPPESATRKSGFAQNGWLNAGESISLTDNFTINSDWKTPLPAGKYQARIDVDASKAIFEHLGEDNNDSVYQKPVVLVPPDLVVSGVSANSLSVTAGDLLEVSYNLLNQGKVFMNAWFDDIYVTASSEPNSTILLSNSQYNNNNTGKPLFANQQQVNNAILALPCYLAPGTYYLWVRADDRGDVTESDETNNRSQPVAFEVLAGDCNTDLAVSHLKVTRYLDYCNEYEVTYDIKNVHTKPVVYGKCEPEFNFYPHQDYIGLRLDSGLTVSYLLVNVRQCSATRLLPGDSMHVSARFRIDSDASAPPGDYWMVAHINALGSLNEINQANNSMATRVTINPLVKPDLVIQVESVSPGIISGQPFSVVLRNKNQRAGHTIGKKQWVNTVDFSTESHNFSNEDDPLDCQPNYSCRGSGCGCSAIGSYTQDSLDPGASVLKTLTLTLPASTPTGYYYLIVTTDANNDICEFEYESNNQVAVQIFVRRPDPADLVVTDIEHLDSVDVGKPFSIHWKVKNLSNTAPASGVMREAVYLSKDQQWSEEDILMGYKDSNISIGPEMDLPRDIQATVTKAALETYFVIVRTDLLDNIWETNNLNNQTSSGREMALRIPLLPIGQELSALLHDAAPLYYRLDTKSEHLGETILVTLTTPDSVQATNQLYLRRGVLPSLDDFDYRSLRSGFGNQEAAIPTVENIPYFLMVDGLKGTGQDSQLVKLKAYVLPFQIRTVDATKGGNAGFATVLLKGAKFDPLMQVYLVADTIQIPLDSLIFVDATKVFARFNLNDKALGQYTLTGLHPNGDTATWQYYEIEPGGPPKVVTLLRHPPSVTTPRIARPSSRPPLVMTLEFENQSNNDIPIPYQPVRSIGEAPLSLSSAGLPGSNATEIQVPLRELNGPVDYLRPGAKGSVLIWVNWGEKAMMFIVEQ